MYDYLIVGTGLFGAVAAHLLTKKGKTCLLIDKRDHETIYAVDESHPGVWNTCSFPSRSGQSHAYLNPTQELVDAYETTDGEPVVLGYADAQHLQPIYNPRNTSYRKNDPYLNRDLRMAATMNPTMMVISRIEAADTLTVFISTESRRLKPQMIAATATLMPPSVSRRVRFRRLMRW